MVLFFVLTVSRISYLNGNFTFNIDIENVCSYMYICTIGETLIN